MPDYFDDTLDNGSTRPQGNTDYVQPRIVAPIVTKSFAILPRLTFRHYENPSGGSGFGNTELFALMIPKSWDWGTGRFGIGPLVTAPGDKEVARDEWAYGFAAGAVNTKGKCFYDLLLTQTWRAVDPTLIPPGTSETSPLGLAPFLNYRTRSKEERKRNEPNRLMENLPHGCDRFAGVLPGLPGGHGRQRQTQHSRHHG